MWYRVRLSWDKPDTQLGAYQIYENAVKKANEVPGYSVYDEAGNVLYTSPLVVKTMSYKAKVIKKFGKYAPGKTVVVTINRKKQWIVEADGTVVPERNYLDLLKQIYDSSVKYNRATAEAWVNNEGFSSKTEWLLWANKYTQKVYIFQGSKKNWVLKKTYKCGTGKISDGDLGDPGLYFNGKIYDHHRTYPSSRGGTLQYFMHYSSPKGNGIHYGNVGKPTTHGCIALAMDPVKWVYSNLPLNTKVILY